MKEKLIPGGILEPVSGKSFLFFGNSYKTSDFMADGLLVWWQHRRPELGEYSRSSSIWTTGRNATAGVVNSCCA